MRSIMVVLYASGLCLLLVRVVLYAHGLLVFLYARRTHKHDNVLNRQEIVLIGFIAGRGGSGCVDAGGLTTSPS